MIEVEVHSALRDFLREHGNRGWPHHLTMARLVARTLRLNSSVSIQTGSSFSQYCISYLMPILLTNLPVILVASPKIFKKTIDLEIPLLKNWLGIEKNIRVGNTWKSEDSLLITTPESWIGDRINEEKRFPDNVTTIIDRAEELEEWTREKLTITIEIGDWNLLLDNTPEKAELIRNTRAKLTKAIFDRPSNPEECYLLDKTELDILIELFQVLDKEKFLSNKFLQFWQNIKLSIPFSAESIDNGIIWVSRQRKQGLFSIHYAPIEVKEFLAPIWEKQPVVLISSFLDLKDKASTYKQKLGLREILSLKFSPNRQSDLIRFYLPNRFPMPNTPDFAKAFIEQAHILVGFSKNSNKLIVLLVEDTPLRDLVATSLASQFGSRVRVNNLKLKEDTILVSSWKFWQENQENLPKPQLLIIATIPFPSLENPLVATQVSYYKRRRKDWFRLYLLPTAISKMQLVIIPLRESQVVVALFDRRVNNRSYGKTILSVLEPCARINYIDPTWFGIL